MCMRVVVGIQLLVILFLCNTTQHSTYQTKRKMSGLKTNPPSFISASACVCSCVCVGLKRTRLNKIKLLLLHTEYVIKNIIFCPKYIQNIKSADGWRCFVLQN